MKVSADGSTLMYSTLLGGSAQEEGVGVVVDAGGNSYLVGLTISSNFPTTPGSYSSSCGQQTSTWNTFVSKLNPQGSKLLYSTCIPNGAGTSIAIDSTGSVYVAGQAYSASFPTTPGAFQRTFNPGSGLNCTMCTNAFILKLSLDGSALAYSTYLGVDNYASALVPQPVLAAVDASGNAFVAGHTVGGLPTQNAVQPNLAGGDGDAFVLMLNAAGTAISYSTYLGGAGDESVLGIAVNAKGEAYTTGSTTSGNFPLLNPLPTADDGGGGCLVSAPCQIAFVTKFAASGSLAYSTYFGGTNVSAAAAILLDPSGNAVVAGSWRLFPDNTVAEGSSPATTIRYPVFPAAGPLEIGGGTGLFLVKLSDTVTTFPLYSRASVTNGASFAKGVAPGAIGTVFGTNLTNVNGIMLASALPLPMVLGGTSVTINGQPVPLFAVANVNGQQQVNFQVPGNITTGPVIAVSNNGSQGFPIAVIASPFYPGVFLIDGVHGAIEHANGQLVTPANPASKGEVVVVFATGLGTVSPDPGPGNPASAMPLSVATITPTATIAGISATVQFSGLAPTFVGLNQVNLQVPFNTPSGDQNLIILSQAAGMAPQASPAVKISVQ